MKHLFAAHKFIIIAIAIAVSSVAAAAAIFTPGYLATGTPGARGMFVDKTDVRFQITQPNGTLKTLSIMNSQQNVAQKLDIQPGGNTGWHSHPGPVLVIVNAGSLTFYDGDDPTCAPRVYRAGDAFIDEGGGHVHIARNEGAVATELWATYFNVPAGGPFRLDAADPGNCFFGRR